MPGLRWILVTLYGLVLTGCSPDSSSHAPAPLRPVRTMLISSSNGLAGKEFAGVVDAAQTAELGFQVGGKLTGIAVGEGEEVTRGQLIAKLDDADLRIALASATADYDKAAADFKRAENLIAKNYISAAEYDALKAGHDSARAQLKAAQQELEYTRLVAPFPGYISRRHVDNFEIVTANQPIVTLQDISSLAVRINLPESVMARVQPDDAGRIIYAEFEAIPGAQFPLTLKEVATQADERSQTYQVTFTMPVPEENIILPGMSATVTGRRIASDGVGLSSLYVPPHAVLEDANGRYVYVAEARPDGTGVIHRRGVDVGNLDSNGLEIVTGLEDGDRVVTAGMSKLHENMPVRLQDR